MPITSACRKRLRRRRLWRSHACRRLPFHPSYTAHQALFTAWWVSLMPWVKSSHSEGTVVCERDVCASVKEDVVIALALTIAAVLGLSVVANSAGTGSIGFVLTATLLSLGLAPFVGDSLERYIPAAAWRRVFLSPTAYRRLGATLYNSMLSASGWNRLIYDMRARERSTASGNTPKRPLRASAVGHTWGASTTRCHSRVGRCIRRLAGALSTRSHRGVGTSLPNFEG